LKEAQDDLPLPPDELRELVAGTTNVPRFLNGGYLGVDSMIKLLRRSGVAPQDLAAILDFGCGCGRAIRHWRRHGVAGLHGTDYNRELIAWCQANLPFADFAVNQWTPPLDYPEESFDLVYALSVFTHLPADLQFAWRDELRRVLRPGGYLLFTLHGRRYLPELAPEEHAQFNAGQLVVRDADNAGTNVCGSFHPEEYVRERFAVGFEVVDFVPEGAKGNPHQDIYLLRRD
jgi:SAM-dependent methyltransferase